MGTDLKALEEPGPPGRGVQGGEEGESQRLGKCQFGGNYHEFAVCESATGWG